MEVTVLRGEPEEPDDVILVLLHVYKHQPSLDFDFASRVRFIPLPLSKITFNPNSWTFPNEIIRTDFAKKNSLRLMIVKKSLSTRSSLAHQILPRQHSTSTSPP